MLFKPKFKLNAVTDIEPSFLEQHNITCLILDVDNTLSTHHGMQLTVGLEDWINEMHSSGIKLVVLSNSKKKRVEPFAQKIGLSYISCALKPLPFGFLRAVRLAGVKRKNAAVVGDQIFTDTLGGNLLGIKTVLLTPILLETGISFRFKRKIEAFLLKHYKFNQR